MKKKTLIMKFGGASLASTAHFDRVAEIICERKKSFSNIAVVVSAMSEMTDRLTRMAYTVHSQPPKRELDMLMTAGERISISILAIALSKKNVEAASFTGSQSGIITTCDHTDAKIISVKPYRIEECFSQNKIAIIAGFQGVSLDKEITTLGKGGSDTTAVALGLPLNASHIEFYKDVEGIYDKDPKFYPKALRYATLSYQEAIKVVSQGAKILQLSSLLLAKQHSIPLQVLSFHKGKNTIYLDRRWGVRWTPLLGPFSGYSLGYIKVLREKNSLDITYLQVKLTFRTNRVLDSKLAFCRQGRVCLLKKEL